MDRESHIAHLIALARIDGVLHAHELIFIQGIALRMGLQGAQFDRIVKHPDMIPARIPDSREARFRNLCELIALMHIDFDTDQKEREYIIKIAGRYGLSPVLAVKAMQYLGTHPLPADTDELLIALEVNGQ